MGLTRSELTTIATRTGCRVVAAWSGRDEGQMGEVVGVVMHHTGSAWGTAVAPTLGIVQNGRSDLQNALCNFYVDRAGTIYLITEKLAWHAGLGKWRGITDGNSRFLGIEAESDGKNWTPETLEAFARLVAEICRFLGVDPDLWAIRHAQWAPTRKVDFSGYNEADFRKRVANRLTPAVAPPPAPAPVVTAPREAIRMRSVQLTADQPTALLTIDPVRKSYVLPTPGARAWVQWGAFCPGSDNSVPHVDWLVLTVVGGAHVPVAPFALPHRGTGSIELPEGCNGVEIKVSGIPADGVVTFHIDAIGHA